jgi:SAM-dependent methyltransferase
VAIVLVLVDAMDVAMKPTPKFCILEAIPRTLCEVVDKENLFDQIYDQQSYQIASESSSMERRTMKARNFTLTYGEILYNSFTEILLTTLSREKSFFNGGSVFIDLGSGTGKASVIAALHSNFKSCIGIEIMPSLHQIALESLISWSELSSVHHSPTIIQFIQGSFLDLSFYDWTIGDLVFANSTCFGREIMSQISNISGPNEFLHCR